MVSVLVVTVARFQCVAQRAVYYFRVARKSVQAALTVYWRNGKVATTDGPYVETKEQLGGILVPEARDINHAIQLISQHPGVKY